MDATLHGELGTIIEWTAGAGKENETDTPNRRMQVPVVAGGRIRICDLRHEKTLLAAPRQLADRPRRSYPATSAMRLAIRLAAAFTGSFAKCAYREVVVTLL